jgi:hypothetical protein
VRTLAAACLAAAAVVTTTALPVLPASAATATRPTLPVGLDGSTVSQVTTLTAQSTAAYVRFEAHVDSATSTVMLAGQVPVVDGQASWKWPTWGFGPGVKVVARDCATDAASSCATSTAALAGVDVANPVTSTDLPTEPILVNPFPADQGGDGPLQVHVVDDGGQGELYLDWKAPGQALVRQPVGSAGTAGMDFYNVVHGTAPVQVVRCSPVSYGICAPAAAPSAPVEVRRRLMPRLTGPSEAVVTRRSDHNADGPEDIATSLNTEPITTSATWTVETDEYQPVVVDGHPAQDVPVEGLVPGGDTPLVVHPDKVLDGTGVVLPDGWYHLVITVHGTDREHEFTGGAVSRFHLDTTPDKAVGLTPSQTTFYPYLDYYQDTVTFTPGYTDGWVPGHAVVLDGAGAVVRSYPAEQFGGGQPIGWDGRDDAGALLPAGLYQMRLLLKDEAGNTSSVTSDPVTLSRKRLVTKTFRRTVSAYASAYDDYSGRCSTVAHPGRRGWKGSLGYYSQAKCTGTKSGMSRVAAVMHAVRLPQAFDYGTVTVRAYGGATRTGSDQAAGMFFQKPNGDLAGKVGWLRPRVAWHSIASHPRAKTLMDRNRWVAWNVFTNSGMRYDVAKFEVTVPYRVLQ